jgi:hypothetical protein
MIITIRETQTIERELNIEFPFITYDKENFKYFFNYDINKCIEINLNTNTIFSSRYSNEGLQFEQISKEKFYAAFDENLKELLQILNK